MKQTLGCVCDVAFRCCVLCVSSAGRIDETSRQHTPHTQHTHIKPPSYRRGRKRKEEVWGLLWLACVMSVGTKFRGASWLFVWSARALRAERTNALVSQGCVWSQQSCGCAACVASMPSCACVVAFSKKKGRGGGRRGRVFRIPSATPGFAIMLDAFAGTDLPRNDTPVSF